jgi:flagellar basal-body rod protein FlgF
MTTAGIEISARAVLAQQARIDVIANNIANAGTVGFRRGTIGFRANLETAMGVDPRTGDLEVTRRPLDLAISGPGSFTVRDLETGADRTTRAGNFDIDSSGRLVTADGRCQVVASDGRPLALDAAIAGSLRVAEDGTLFSGDVEYGQLGVVVEDVARPAQRGDGLIENRGVSSPGSRIQQGTLERSSVDPALESADMVRALRALEANLEVIRILDATLERTVSEFARPAK